MRVKHRTYGTGEVCGISNGIIEIKFGTQIKRFQFPKAFDAYLQTDDEELLKCISEARQRLESSKTRMSGKDSFDAKQHASKGIRKSTFREVNVHSSLIGERAQTIAVASEEEMFELVGYMAAMGRVGSIEAEIPKDGRDAVFEKLFPNQTYRPIELGNTPSGLPNKLSPQFRINFNNLRNCPHVLKANMGKGNGSCVGRINKSKFVLDIVQNYGFRFGDHQNVTVIREIARQKGYLESFERGFAR